MLKIDQYAYINRLAHVHPLEKMVLALVTMIICLVFSSPATSLIVILSMAGMVIWLARIPASFFLKLMLAPVAFLLLSVLTVAFVWVKDPAGLLWGFNVGCYTVGVTSRGLITAGALLLKSLGAVACLYFLSLTTPMVDILSVLKALRMPPLFIELMSLVYRFIFVLLDTADKIYTSQASRWGYATLKTSYSSLGQLVSNLFTKASRNYQMLYTTLTSRCYTGELNVLESSHVISRRNILLIILFEAALLLASIHLAGFLTPFAGGAGS